jgi:endonuclease
VCDQAETAVLNGGEIKMRADYKTWLEEQKYGSGTITSQLHRTSRVEDCYGNIEELHKSNNLQPVLDELIYSTADERRNKPNPSKIPFEGNVRNNLASYRNAVALYLKFLGLSEVEFDVQTIATPTKATDDVLQKLSLERDMQAALRREIKKLGQTLSIIDDGAERSVVSGLIDITCEDSADNAMVVIELKAGKADSRAIGQVLGYMGDLAQEEDGRIIRGILVAHEFDKRTLSAARAVPTLRLVKYSVEFRFDDEIA